MNRTRLALVAALSVAAFAAQAQEADLSGQFAITVGSQAAAPAPVRFAAGEANPWATSYNPLASFRGQRTRAEVTAEYLASRNVVAAFTGEDSGSAYLAAAPRAIDARTLAGTPVNAQ